MVTMLVMLLVPPVRDLQTLPPQRGCLIDALQATTTPATRATLATPERLALVTLETTPATLETTPATLETMLPTPETLAMPAMLQAETRRLRSVSLTRIREDFHFSTCLQPWIRV